MENSGKTSTDLDESLKTGNELPSFPNPIVDGSQEPNFRSVPSSEGWRWFQSSIRVFNEDRGFWIFLSFTYLVLSFILSILPSAFSPLILITYPVSFLLGIGPVYLSVRRHLKKSYKFEDLFLAFRTQTGPLIRLMILELWLSLLVLMACAGIPLALLMNRSGQGHPGGWWNQLQNADPSQILALISSHLFELVMIISVGGTLMIALYLAGIFSTTLVLFHGMRASRALLLSVRCGLQNLGPITLLSLAFLLGGLLSLLTLGLGLLVLVPLYFISTGVVYSSLFSGVTGELIKPPGMNSTQE